MGKRLSYVEKIKESVAEIKKIEKRQTDSILRDRVKFIRFLKHGEAKTQKEASDLIGVRERQGQLKWRLYKDEGLLGMINPIYKGGRHTKLKEGELEELKRI